MRDESSTVEFQIGKLSDWYIEAIRLGLARAEAEADDDEDRIVQLLRSRIADLEDRLSALAAENQKLAVERDAMLDQIRLLLGQNVL